MSEIATTLLAAFGGAAIAAPVVGWILSKWLGARIEGSVRHEYDRRKVDYETENKRRERAQLVAELLAEWQSTAPGKPMTSEQRKRLNRLSFECTLWLPEDISRELNKVLQRDHNALNRFEVLLKVRTLLSGPHSLTTPDVTYWDSKKELPNDGLPDDFVHGQLIVQGMWQEEREGERIAITPAMLERVFVPARGSKVFFEVRYTGKLVTICTEDIKLLRLISVTRAGEDVVSMTVELNPQSLADDIAHELMKRVPESDGLPKIADG